MTAAEKSGPTVRVRQVRSGTGFDKTQKATLKALGLGRLGRVREVPDNAQIRGMVAKIRHLIVVESAGAAGDRT